MLKPIILTAMLAILPLESAFADRGGRDRHDRKWDRHDRHYNHHHNRPRTVVSFNYSYGPYYRPYHHSYYRPTRVVYAPQPVYVQPQVVYINDSNSRAVSSNDGRYCREYQTISKVGGASRQTYGTACMQPDGSWEIQI
jgi:hypothetical protein